MVDSDGPNRTHIARRTGFTALAVVMAVAAIAFTLSKGAHGDSPSRHASQSLTAAKPTAVDDAVPTVHDASTKVAETPVSAVPTTASSPVLGATPAVVPTAPRIAVIPTPPISTLVSEVEAAGIDPGSNWSWSVGDTGTHCGVITGVGTGCTYGAAGLEYTIFGGTPTLALVAHELANAETQNDAIPSLLNEVAAAAAGTSWSPTDGVASCLVEHFMGFQDNAAGTWQCPPALATTVANNIHDT
jgi:hypothetical protein